MEMNDFKSQLGLCFKIQYTETETIDLELKSIEPFEKTKNFENAREEPFSLVFIGPNELHLPDNTYVMKTEQGEEILLFISAFKQDDAGIYYDSIIN